MNSISKEAKIPEKPGVVLKPRQVAELLVLVGVSVLLLLYLLLRSTASFGYQVPTLEKLDSTEIKSIRWARSSGKLDQILRKKGSDWFIGEERYPIKQRFVDTLIEQISEPKLQDLVSQSGSLVTFGLDPEKVYVLQAYADDDPEDKDPLRQLYVGKSSSSGRYSYVRLGAEDNKVYTLAENLSSVLEKSVEDLRDREVMKFQSNDIVKLEIRDLGGDKEISIEKQEEEWGLPEDTAWGKDEIESLVKRFALINAEEFLQSFPEGDSGYEVRFTAKDGTSNSMTIAAESLGEDRGYPAKSSSYGFPFTVNNYTVESMLEDFNFKTFNDETGE